MQHVRRILRHEARQRLFFQIDLHGLVRANLASTASERGRLRRPCCWRGRREPQLCCMEQADAWPIRIYTVSQLTSRIRDSLHKQFRDVLVEGEISNFKLYPSGHLYFTLKDETASLRAIMFNFHGRYPEDFIKDGSAVICRGRIDVYEKRGRIQAPRR